MKVTSTVTVFHDIKVKDEDLGGVTFANVNEGDLLYSDYTLVKVTRKTPKRAYVSIVREAPREQRLPFTTIPGSIKLYGNRPNYYFEDFGGLYVTLPDYTAFDRITAVYAAHTEEIENLKTVLEKRYAERAVRVVEEMLRAKGLKTKVEVL